MIAKKFGASFHAFLHALSFPATLLTNVSLKGWFFRVARSSCLDELSRRCRRAQTPFSSLEWDDGEEEHLPFETIIDPDPIPEELAERVELARWLHEAVASLPPKLRVVVHLHCFRQLTYAEIGRLLNMSEMTVKTHFSRSLPRLRKALMKSMWFAPAS